MDDHCTHDLIGHDPDNDALLIEPSTPPINGVISSSPRSRTGGAYGDAGVRALLLDGEYICRDGGPYRSRTTARATENIRSSGATITTPSPMPGGDVHPAHMCYATFSPTFSGTDSFTYKATDVYGASRRRPSSPSSSMRAERWAGPPMRRWRAVDALMVG